MPIQIDSCLLDGTRKRTNHVMCPRHFKGPEKVLNLISDWLVQYGCFVLSEHL